MEINKELIEKVAKVSRLKLSEKEIREFQPQLNEIVKFFSILDEADTKSIKPSFQPIEIKNVLREDKVIQKDQGLLSNTKHKKDNVSATKSQVATYSDLIDTLVKLEVAGKKGSSDYTKDYAKAKQLKESENERSKIQETLNKQIETEILLRDNDFKSQQQIVDLLLEANNIGLSTDKVDELRGMAAELTLHHKESNLLKEAELTLIKEKEKLLKQEARSMKEIFKDLKENNNRDFIPPKAIEQVEGYNLY